MFNTSRISISGGNELTQVMKMVEKMQTRFEVSEKKIELMASTLKTLIKNAPKEKCEKPR